MCTGVGEANCLVLSTHALVFGSVVHITEDGTETLLTTPGTTLIQRGTSHAWENRSDDWVRWITVLMDAEPVALPSAKGGKVPATESLVNGWVPPSRGEKAKL